MIDKIDIMIWGRNFSLPVEYDCHEGETVTNEQEHALSEFMNKRNIIEKSLKSVEDYCKKDVMADEENQKKDNVFSYIMPQFIYVERSAEPRVSVLCRYRYDPEHGLAVTFTKKGDISVDVQDAVL